MPQLTAAIIPVTPFQQNCALIWDADSGKGVVIDPGGDVDSILATIKEANVTVERILLTHGHIDHVGGAADLAAELSVPVEGPHRDDAMLIDNIELQGQQFGLSGAKSVVPDRWLEEGDTVSIGGESFDVFHCPGHAPGHIIFVNKPASIAILGDVLFNGSIGRTDLPGGDTQTLLNSIREKVLPLGDEVSFLCGHGQPSTIGHERKTNPFLKDL